MQTRSKPGCYTICLGSSSTFFTIVLAVTVVILGWVPIFKVFSVFHTMAFLLGSKYASSKHATSCYLDGVYGTNPSSTIKRFPPVSILVEVDRIFFELSQTGLCPWFSRAKSSWYFFFSLLCIFLDLVSPILDCESPELLLFLVL